MFDVWVLFCVHVCISAYWWTTAFCWSVAGLCMIANMSIAIWFHLRKRDRDRKHWLSTKLYHVQADVRVEQIHYSNCINAFNTLISSILHKNSLRLSLHKIYENIIFTLMNTSPITKSDFILFTFNCALELSSLTDQMKTNFICNKLNMKNVTMQYDIDSRLQY